MSSTLAVVRAYHRSWTSKHFDDASRLLSSALKLEVPINEYPDKASFIAAVAAFGAATSRVDLLGEFANANEAMLLYDMQIDGVGKLRVAEHFTVADGTITRIRQIHDTAPIRAAFSQAQR